MPLPPIPTQIAGQVKISSKDTPNLKKRPAPAKTVVMESHAPDWAIDTEEDLSAAEVALEKIKSDRSPIAPRNDRSDKRAAIVPEKPKRIIRTGPPSLFVLDTNVLMHDPSSLFRFSEHDLFLPMTTLEELDNHKKGMTEVARNARTVSRSLDQLVAGTSGTLDEGIPLNKLGNQDVSGRLFFQTRQLNGNLPATLPGHGADNAILAQTLALQQEHRDARVTLVSKDINLRIKAAILGAYLTLAPYGGNLEGVRAASLAWFGKEPRRLSAAEAALLVALPQAPEARRPDRDPKAARRARDRVLDRALATGVIDAATAEAARER